MRKPADRHDPRKIREKDQGRRGTRNTIIEPRVDIQADLDAINRGDGIIDRHWQTIWVNGRLWGYHADTGTIYPMEGGGFVQMTQLQFFALRVLVRYNGINPQSERMLANNPDMTDEDRDIARRIWRMREEAGN